MGIGRAFAVTVIATAAAAAEIVGNARSRIALPTPLPIHASSLTQSGRELVWRVSLEAPFTPAGLARVGRSLCLLIERVKGGTVAGSACVEGPAPHAHEPRIVYARVVGGSTGRAHVIDATITRASSSELAAAFLPSAVGLGYAELRWQTISTLRQSACGPPARGPAGCFTLLPANPALLQLHPPRLVGCVPSGPAEVFHGPTDRREVALTFDDGPSYQTPQFVDVLERERAVATFFQIGDQIAQFGEHGLDRRMLSDGDMIGDHTWNYGGNVAAGGAGAVSQISKAAAAIREASGGFSPCLFRAPGGRVTPALLRTARALGFDTIQWSVDPRDWTRPGARAIYRNVISNVRPGSIVIQHDGGGDRSETLTALPLEIETLRRERYRFVTVTQMLGYTPIYR